MDSDKGKHKFYRFFKSLPAGRRFIGAVEFNLHRPMWRHCFLHLQMKKLRLRDKVHPRARGRATGQATILLPTSPSQGHLTSTSLLTSFQPLHYLK